MDYNEAKKFIDDCARFSMKLGLDRVKKLLELLKNPHKNLKFIHVAGTNGKGSITAMISSILKEEGYTVGMYTSPYIEEFEERIQINGKNIPKKDLTDIINEVYKATQKVIELGYEHPTQFEIITCAAFLYYYKMKVDYAVIEVGLGGRLDATNVITPIISIISSISYDHVKILGNTLDKIAYEKAGIIKNGVPVVLYPQKGEVYSVIEKVCKDRSAELIQVNGENSEFLGCNHIELNGMKKTVQNIIIRTEQTKYNINLALLGKHQILNCSTVIYAIEKLKQLNVNISNKSILSGLLKVNWIGRFEILKTNPNVIIDGAHNIDGITKLKQSVEYYLKYKNIILILGILADKQVNEMVKVVAPMAQKVICVTPNSERGEIAEELALEVKKYNKNCIAIENYREAYEQGLNYCDKDDLLLISGSLYMIGDMRKIIKNKVL